MEILYSDAWPKDNANLQAIAPIHEILKHARLSAEDIYYRDLEYKIDSPKMHPLHDEWFPLKYKEDFYIHLFHHHKNINIGAFVRIGEKEYLIGSISGVFSRNTHMPMNLLKALFSECVASCLPYTCYICSIGVIDEARKMGIGGQLLMKLEEKVRRMKECQTISLHVIAYNIMAIEFYKKRGFGIICTRRNYYTIFYKSYSAYYMEKPMHPKGIKKLV